MKLKPREWRYALIAGVVIGCFLVVTWIVQPLWDHLRELHMRTATQMEKLEALSRLAAQAPAIDRAFEQLAPYLAGDDSEQAHSAFLDELASLSSASGLQVNFKPRPVKRDDSLSRFQVELDVEGTQVQLLSFLDGLFGMPKLVAVERLRIANVPSKAQWLRANLVIEKLSLSP